LQIGCPWCGTSLAAAVSVLSTPNNWVLSAECGECGECGECWVLRSSDQWLMTCLTEF
jgi:hypothetical protein